VNDIEKRIPFSHDDRLGFLTFCPTNLGTTVRASVHIKVPKLAADKAKLEEVAGKYNLQVSVPLCCVLQNLNCTGDCSDTRLTYKLENSKIDTIHIGSPF
jgi:protein-arginine kinase